mmetsp:Transcript_5754/g.20115  ORF Transcript_5754/g.20115 Transcript_5754/m.20115 type:complete len:369 (+) Transcript_5754:1532-2638(+)
MRVARGDHGRVPVHELARGWSVAFASSTSTKEIVSVHLRHVRRTREPSAMRSARLPCHGVRNGGVREWTTGAVTDVAHAHPQPKLMSVQRSSSSNTPTGLPLRTSSANMSLGSISSKQYKRSTLRLSMPCQVLGGNTANEPGSKSNDCPSKCPTPLPDKTKKSSYPSSCTWSGVMCPGSNTSTPKVALICWLRTGSNMSAKRLVWLGNWYVSTSLSLRRLTSSPSVRSNSQPSDPSFVDSSSSSTDEDDPCLRLAPSNISTTWSCRNVPSSSPRVHSSSTNAWATRKASDVRRLCARCGSTKQSGRYATRLANSHSTSTCPSLTCVELWHGSKLRSTSGGMMSPSPAPRWSSTSSSSPALSSAHPSST